MAKNKQAGFVCAVQGSRFAAGAGVSAACAGVLLVCCGVASGQSQITPSAPSIPLSPAALANGVQNRITTQYGIEFVTIGGVNNAPWPGSGSSNDDAAGKGSVDHEYRMGRFEVTTAQWAQFLSAVAARPSSDSIPYVTRGWTWGGMADPSYAGPGTRYIARPGLEMAPVGGITWRTAAIYCNWLHNGQATNRSAFMGGAYDVSTFGYIGAGDIFTDQLVRSPGAKFFIPNISEWVKAAHYDPNRNGTGQGGYWQYSITSDTAPVYAPPGVLVNGQPGQSNSFDGFFTNPFPGYSPYGVPLGGYPVVQSPWGLMDTASGTREWEEDPMLAYGTNPIARFNDGSAWGDGAYAAALADRISNLSGDWPNIAYGDYGFRVAAAIPSASTAGLIFSAMAFALRRSRAT